MEFGKVATSELHRIDLSLPADDPRTWICLGRAQSDPGSPLRLGVGCPVWGVKDWVGKIYPPGTRPKDYLFHYARQFTSIELNTTHYRIPDRETIERWKETAPDGFKFNLKWPQEISHRRPLASHDPLIHEFCIRSLELEDRLGISFLQLPPTFSPLDLPDLRQFLAKLPERFPLAVEVRHPGFFTDHRLATPLFDLLQKTDTHVVITDVAGRRDVLHTSLPTERVLVRFIGNDLHPTDDVRIAEWVARLQTWIHLGLKQVEFFVHQPEDRNAPVLVARLIDRLNQACGFHLPKWRPMDQEQQLGLF